MPHTTSKGDQIGLLVVSVRQTENTIPSTCEQTPQWKNRPQYEEKGNA